MPRDLGNGKTNRDQVVRVDLHCHSDVSDGYFSPAEAVRLLSESGVIYASLTDHNSIDGLPAFHEAAVQYGITDISGVELHADFYGTEVHLLAYGFDPENSLLQGFFTQTGNFSRVIAAVHEAGGIVFLAHPLQAGWDHDKLEDAVKKLAEAGLDGIEAYYKPYSEDSQEMLASLADSLGMLTCGGSDFHGYIQGISPSPGMDMPASQWRKFSSALGDGAKNGGYAGSIAGEDTQPLSYPGSMINWRWLFLRIIFPSLMVISFFLILLFAVLIPTMESLLLERKREMTSELTNSAWSILSDYDREVREGNKSLEEAQQAAVDRIRRMRYGPEGKDYFWITDMHPRMVMHPYRDDLEGEDLSDFTDPDGVRPFVEFAEAVRSYSSGYVRYVWQWQDDPDRMEAKESYIRGFAPWGWIIGTGLYVDDVSREISAVTGRVVDISFIVTVITSGLLVMISWQALKVEKKRSSAEAELRISHERYQTLVESSSSGTLLLAGKRCSYANRKFLELLKYTAAELAFLDISDVLAGEQEESGRYCLDQISQGKEIHEPVEVKLKRRDGRTLPVLLSAIKVFFSEVSGLMLSVQDTTRHRRLQVWAERDRLIEQLQSSQLFLTEPVRSSMAAPVSCTLDTSIAHAVRLMGRRGTDALTILDSSGELVGIITDRDIRERVVAVELDTRMPVSRIMSSPVESISENAPIFEAFLLEHGKNIEHLAVTDETGDLVGIIRSSRTVRPDRYSLVVLIRQVQLAESVEALDEYREQIPSLVSSLVDSGAQPQHACHVMTSVSDAVVQRVTKLMLQEMGPAPARFAFIALGSEARREQTLAADQDNALIYDDMPGESTDAEQYFLQLGSMICAALDRLGFTFCAGGTMAKNPRWNQTAKQWEDCFTNWITEPDDEALAGCNIFFDLRHICGDRSLVHALKQHVYREVFRNPAFFSYLALNTIRYKPPLGLFGQILTSSEGQSLNSFNVKEAMLPIVNYARLYAVKHQLEETNTLDRLRKLRDIGVIQEEGLRGLSQAYIHLMQLRLRHQVELLRSSLPADNAVDPVSLTRIDAGIIKHSFSQISLIQKKLSLDIKGML